MAETTAGGAGWQDWGNWAAALAEAHARLWQTWLSLAQPGVGTRAAAGGASGGEPQAAHPWLRLVQAAWPPGTAASGGWLVEQWSAPMRVLAAFTPVFAPFAAAGSAPLVPQDALMRGIGAFWGLPIDMWRRLTASLSALPGDAALDPKRGGPSQSAATEGAGLERFLSIPPFGYSREWQEQGQQALRDALAYQRAQADYVGILTRIAVRTGEIVCQRLAARAAEAKPIQSLREAYDLFVDCGEDAYAEVVTAADFGAVSAQLMNAAIAVKRHAQTAIEEMANTMNLPTRRELDTAHRQAQTMRRQFAALQAEMPASREPPAAAVSAELDAVRQELQALRAELAALRGAQKAEAAKAVKPARAAAASARPVSLEGTEG